MMKHYLIEKYGVMCLCLVFLLFTGCSDDDKASRKTSDADKKASSASGTVRKKIETAPATIEKKPDAGLTDSNTAKKPDDELPKASTVEQPKVQGQVTVAAKIEKQPASVAAAPTKPDISAASKEISPESKEVAVKPVEPIVAQPSSGVPELTDVPPSSIASLPQPVTVEAKSTISPTDSAEQKPGDKFLALPPELIDGQLSTPKPVTAQSGVDKPSESIAQVIENKMISAITGIYHKKKQVGIVDEYDPSGRVEPFKSLVIEEDPEKLLQARKDERKRQTERLTPLQKLELSQLKLVAVIRAQSGNRAMVEEANGKGYIIKEGTPIGVNMGKVHQIFEDRIVVLEEEYDWKGNLKMIERPMVIQKPAGEF